MQPAEEVASFPERTFTTTATNQPTVRELNEAYWRERQRAEMLGSYGIDAAPIQEPQTRVEMPDWLRKLLPEGFSERFVEAATGAPITFTGGGPVVGGLMLPKAQYGPEYLRTRGGQEIEPGPEPELELDPYSYRGAFPFWEEKLADLLPPEPVEPPPTWYDTGGGGWYPWGGGGGTTYTPQKAASRWWMNLAKWNI